MATHPTSDELLNDPGTSAWLRDALTSALRRDPGAAATDAAWLMLALVQQLRQVERDGEAGPQ